MDRMAPEAGQVRAVSPPGITPAALFGEIARLRAGIGSESARTLDRWQAAGIERRRFRLSAANFARYLALRRHDLRPLQAALMPLGLSSLGRCEGRVEETLSAVLCALAAIAGRPLPADCRPPGARRYFRGERALRASAAELFGPARSQPDADGEPPRQVRILATLPSEAATDPELLMRLVAAGTDAVRINCAHDGVDAWAAMIRHLRAAEVRYGRRLRVLMDLGGPKVRTGGVLRPDDAKRLHPGDMLMLLAGDAFPRRGGPAFQAVCTLPAILGRVQPGHRVFIDDGKLETVVTAVEPGAVLLRVVRAGPDGFRLKAEKGLNLPDTDLGLAALTEEDRADLAFVAQQADLIGYSFVQSAGDVRELQAELARLRPADWRRLGLVAKIETPRAIRNLPEIILAAAGQQPLALMIARGDLAVELGFERTAEMQEELLWLAEAAHVPVIWATQVLESLVKTGLPTRGEMTDAAMSARAECVMLNKGPRMVEAVQTLDRLLTRMAGHQAKKTPQLRALRSW